MPFTMFCLSHISLLLHCNHSIFKSYGETEIAVEKGAFPKETKEVSGGDCTIACTEDLKKWEGDPTKLGNFF